MSKFIVKAIKAALYVQYKAAFMFIDFSNQIIIINDFVSFEDGIQPVM
jgi:hypothetical protein